MKYPPITLLLFLFLSISLFSQESSSVYKIQQGFVNANGVMIYYEEFGSGKPLMIVHGGPGASHDYFLPYLLPLAKNHRLIFIDERGSGKSERLEDASLYTVDNMVEDVEAVRKALELGKMDLLGHSYGGVLVQAYALKYKEHLSHLILCSTFSSTSMMNEVFVKIKENMTPELRERINKMESEGLYGHGLPYEQNRYTEEYKIAAWGEGYFPYLYQKNPDPDYDPAAGGFSWALYREMWGSDGEFIINGNLVSAEYTDMLNTITVPTLINCGDNDECAPSLSELMHEKIPGSELVIYPQSGHMTFVDQPDMFIKSIEDFLK